jgi:hypothetical protein
MDSVQTREFICRYFKRLFNDRDVAVLEECLDGQYWDDDIGKTDLDHVQKSKDFVSDLFRRVPTIGVEVRGTAVLDDVITAYLEWFDYEKGMRSTWMRGVGVFEMKGGRILKRHTYIYYRRSDGPDA